MTNYRKVDAQAKADMINSLNAFEKASRKAANKIASSAKSNNQLNEALHTKLVNVPTQFNETPTGKASFGVQVGSYAVFAIPSANGKTRYDVANQTTGEKILGNLHLVEVANSIVSLLNKSYSFYSPQVKTLLEFEEKYSKHYQDALTFKRKSQDDKKDTILETRFEESKRKALEIRENLKKFVSTL